MIFFVSFFSFENTSAEKSKFSTTEKSVVAHIYKNQSGYSINELKVIGGKSDYRYDYEIYKGTDYDGNVVSFSGKILGYYPANQMSLMLCFDNFDPKANNKGGCQELKEGNIELRIPYFPNGKYADIYNPKGEKILTIDLSSKATCNENNICDKPIEGNGNCPSDCEAEEEAVSPNGQKSSGYSSEQAVATDQTQPIQEKKKGMSTVMLVLLIIVLLVVVIGVVIFWLKKRNNDKNEFEDF